MGKQSYGNESQILACFYIDQRQYLRSIAPNLNTCRLELVFMHVDPHNEQQSIMYYTVPSKNKQICHQKDSTQRSSKNMQVTCPKFWHKCDGECRHGISDHKG